MCALRITRMRAREIGDEVFLAGERLENIAEDAVYTHNSRLELDEMVEVPRLASARAMPRHSQRVIEPCDLQRGLVC